MTWLSPLTLRGTSARLEPLSPSHHDALVAATRDGDLWKLWYTTVPAPAQMREVIDRRLGLQASGAWLPFTIIDNRTDAPVGMTNYIDADAANKRLEIGGTWYGRSVQRSSVNTECKLMLLQHAFDTLGCVAVEFRTHFFNHQSRRAIERLGAKLDGILRNHRILGDGSLRDTCVYSIIQPEWPTVKTHLRYQLGMHGSLVNRES
jgi:N-acetyltransferase